MAKKQDVLVKELVEEIEPEKVESLSDIEQFATDDEKDTYYQKFKSRKARAFMAIIWEDSTDIERFKKLVNDLAMTGVRVLYIRHDKDKNPDSTLKKIHWHVIFIFADSNGGTTTYLVLSPTLTVIFTLEKGSLPLRF